MRAMLLTSFVEVLGNLSQVSLILAEIWMILMVLPISLIRDEHWGQGSILCHEVMFGIFNTYKFAYFTLSCTAVMLGA